MVHISHSNTCLLFKNQRSTCDCDNKHIKALFTCDIKSGPLSDTFRNQIHRENGVIVHGAYI